jgi:hypothetical protein
MSHRDRPLPDGHTDPGDELPPELRYADSGDSSRRPSGLPIWVRLTAAVLVVAVIAFYVLSYLFS